MLSALKTLAQDYTYTYSSPTAVTGNEATMSPIMVILWLAVAVLVIVSMWKLFKKANRPGWAAIVPVYNDLQMLWTVGRPWWWIFLMMIPFVNIVVAFVVVNDLSKSFGKGMGMTLLLFFLPFIGLPVLAFGKAAYQGPAALKSDASDNGADAPSDTDTTPPAPAAK